MRPAKSHHERPTIGFLNDLLYNEYNTSIWCGVRDTAWARGANLIFYPGCMFSTPDKAYRPAEVLFDLVNEETLDGMVIWGGNLGHYVTDPAEVVGRFCQRYQSLPLVNIGLALEGVHSLLVDNYQGMHDVVTHLVEVHGYRRIAFLCGPDDNIEMQERYRAYLDVLAKHDIALDPALVVSWSEALDWHQRHTHAISRRIVSVEGEASIPILLDQRKLIPGMDFDAVVGHSDGPTLDMLDLLNVRGIQVPYDVAVASFDDIEESRYATPPLTAARQSFYDLGAQATEMLLALLAGDVLPERVTLPMKLVVRQSCGCSDPAVERAVVELLSDQPNRSASREKIETILAARREKIVSKMVEAVRESAGELDPGWAGRVWDTFLTVFLGRQPMDVFLRTLDEVLRQVMKEGGDATVWEDAVSVLRQQVLPYLEGDVLLRAENIWQQARVFIGEMVRRSWAYQARQAAWQARTLREIETALITTFDIGELMNMLPEGLSRLNIPSAYLSLYEDPGNPSGWSRLMMAYDNVAPLALERIKLETGGLASVGAGRNAA